MCTLYTPTQQENKRRRCYHASVPVRRCRVSFVDPNGFQHSVRVQAQSVYEAAVVAIRAFREHGCEPGPASQIEVEVQAPSVTHTVTLRKVEEWVESSARSPKQKVAKERLRGLLAS